MRFPLLIACVTWGLAALPLAAEESALPSRYEWTAGPPLFAAAVSDTDLYYSIKDPTVVRHNDRWHLFCTVRGKQRSHQIEYLSFADWKDLPGAKRQMLNLHDGYFCAPQVFYFTPHKKWYMVYQTADKDRRPRMQPAWTTNEDIADARSWTKPKLLFEADPKVEAWIDFWVICDAKKAHLFFTSNNGKMWRSETAIERFPGGFDQPRMVLEGDIFEASHTYKVKDKEEYVTLIEAQGNRGRRYYKAYVADALDGAWKPLAATRENPFAAIENVRFTGINWTTSISHGELIRGGIDERLEIDPKRLQFLYQGVNDAGRESNPYGQIPWMLGILELK
jgi:hypothetical protein